MDNGCFICFVGAGIGSVFGSLVIGYARNPSLKQQLFSYAILGFALSEAMGLFCLMMAFLILFAFWSAELGFLIGWNTFIWCRSFENLHMFTTEFMKKSVKQEWIRELEYVQYY